MVVDYIAPIAQLITAVVLALNYIQSRRNGQKSDRIEKVQAVQRKDMAELAANTNSIKDALVVSEKKASHAEGAAEGLAQGRSENVEQPTIKVDIVKFPED